MMFLFKTIFDNDDNADDNVDDKDGIVDDNDDNQGGIHIYHLLSTYIASWPTLLFSLLTVILCHPSIFALLNVIIFT